jgi:hypothetical protein
MAAGREWKRLWKAARHRAEAIEQQAARYDDCGAVLPCGAQCGAGLAGGGAGSSPPSACGNPFTSPTPRIFRGPSEVWPARQWGILPMLPTARPGRVGSPHGSGRLPGLGSAAAHRVGSAIRSRQLPPGGHLCGSALLRGEARKEAWRGIDRAFDGASTSDVYCIAAESADTSRLRGEHPDIYV